MNRYQSHKIVEAARITEFNSQESQYTVVFEDGTDMALSNYDGARILKMAIDSGGTVNGGWLMVYKDGYVSWSPSEAFDEGYDLVQPSSGKSAIAGYRELTEAEISDMNYVKNIGKEIGDVVELLRNDFDHDQRWVSLGATHFQQGLMCLTRSIAKPDFF